MGFANPLTTVNPIVTVTFPQFISDSATNSQPFTVTVPPPTVLAGPNDDVGRTLGLADNATFSTLLVQLVGPNDTLAPPASEGTVTLVHN